MRNFQFTGHAIRQARAKGFTPEQIMSALHSPEKITDVRRYPGQKRHCGAGVAVVVDGDSVITMYEDGVVTPLRADQMNDAAALNSRRINHR